MDSSRYRQLASEYEEAAGRVQESQNRVQQTVANNGPHWKGELRDKFTSDYEDTQSAYRTYYHDLIHTGQQLRRAADKIDELKREIERQERREREERERRAREAK
ncbi:WXG100 family type VII secretion target [Paenibacillus phyllosphaerae]|uniref:ESAT-6-like protein n=1 Tax=Paenibacillus phyllosphaerae TaxID=274593 RepID=A0A7W5AZN2_9BACL|nr:WXG100 family type VII secretion target [Paenibacillus phyllosphaerae]MBB3110991.1 WXG100 family type VII secretion target [Paenibacillus phyllosphaerae]